MMHFRFFSHTGPVGVVSFLCLFVIGSVAGLSDGNGRELPEPTWERLPRWRGFNLLEKFHLDWKNEPYRESDFRLIAELGFNFVRLPIDYRTYVEPGDWLAFREPILEEIDKTVEWGGLYGIHVQINLHRIPGYTVASPAEEKSLWTDPEAREAAAVHWRQFATRYRGISNRRLSFNLLNEPAGAVTPEVYAEVVALLAESIRSVDPDRLIVADGMGWGRDPVPELNPLKVAQATRGYSPFQLTHYRAGWVDGSDQWPVPTWAGLDDGFRNEMVQPWIDFRDAGTGVMVGEWGAYNKTPHDVTLAWMRDMLQLCEEAGFGWALWNFRGDFGPMDSGRADVDYEPFEGGLLDRKMMVLLQEFSGSEQK